MLYLYLMNVIPYEFEPTKLPSIDGVPSDEEAYMVRMYFQIGRASCRERVSVRV